MAVGRKELREYFEPALGRKAFRFHQLRGLVHEGTMQSLRVAKIFSRPDNTRLARELTGHGLRLVGSSDAYGAKSSNAKRNDGHVLIRELLKADPPLKAPVLRILKDMAESAGPCGVPPAIRSEAMARIHDILLECGVHAFFQKPSSAGLMLHWREAGGFPMHMFLGESDGGIIGQGRLNLAFGGGGSIEIDITQNAARLIQALDYWLSDADGLGRHIDPFKLKLSRIPKKKLLESLPRMFEKASLSENEIPVLYALDISCLRLIMARFDSIASESPSARSFLMRALNMQVDWTVAHEVAHLEEHRASGSLPLHPMVKEAIAYFLQAIHADPADAFRTMMLRGFDITRVMPSFDSALRALGPHVFCVEGDYLRGWARKMLDAILDRCAEAGGMAERPNPAPIRLAQTSDFITESDMPYIERALCNPNRRIGRADIKLDNAQPP
jgi:hypothetical protein